MTAVVVAVVCVTLDGTARPVHATTTVLTEDLVTGGGRGGRPDGQLRAVRLGRMGHARRAPGIPRRSSPTIWGDGARYLAGWNEGLLGIREGGRRLFIAPPANPSGETTATETTATETVIYVLDALRVS